MSLEDVMPSSYKLSIGNGVVDSGRGSAVDLEEEEMGREAAVGGGCADKRDTEIYVTRGFTKKLFDEINDPDSSFGNLAKLLVFQPPIIAHLLRIANLNCLKHGVVSNILNSKNRMLEKPTSVEGIISSLGFHGVLNELPFVRDTQESDESRFKQQAIDSYVLGSVFASLAEEKLGRYKPADFFLAGLLAGTVENDKTILDGCNKNLQAHFSAVSSVNIPKIAEAKHFIEKFQKEQKNDGGYLYASWENALRMAHETIK